MSWVANLFTPAQPSNLASSNDRGSPTFSTVQDDKYVNEKSLWEGWGKEQAQSTEEEEEIRSPYWQVSQQPQQCEASEPFGETRF